MTQATSFKGVRQRRRARTAGRQSRRPVLGISGQIRRPRRKKIAPGFIANEGVAVQPILTRFELQYDERVGRSRKTVRKVIARIKRHHDRGEQLAVQRLELILLSSHACRLVAAARARRRLARLGQLKAKERGTYDPSRKYGPTRKEALHVAGIINLRNPTREKVGIRTEEKNHGGFRAIHGFGLEHRARQEMILMVATNRAELHPAQYAQTKGLKQAQRDILCALDTGEYSFAITADIRSYFNHIDVGTLSELLRLSPELIDVNVDSSSFNVDPRRKMAVQREIDNYEIIKDETDYDHDDANERVIGSIRYRPYQGTPGISQGSSCSPIISEIVMADILSHMLVRTRMFNWVDDLFILAGTREEAERAIQTLSEALASARGGNFQAKAKIHSLADGCEFIGSKFQRCGEISTIQPTAKNKYKLVARMTVHLYEISHDGADSAKAERVLTGWLAANSLWSGADGTKRHYLSEIRRAKAQYGRYFQGRSRERRTENTYHLRRMGEAFPNFRRGAEKCVRSSSLDNEYSAF